MSYRDMVVVAFRYMIALLVLLSWSSDVNAQSGNAKASVGFLVEANFSGMHQNGMTPSIVVGNDCHGFQLGARFGFSKMTGNADYYNLFLDAGYRVSYFNRSWVSLFGTFRTEYGHAKYDDLWYYSNETFDPTPGIYLGEESFMAQKTGQANNVAFYLGSGAEFRIMEDVFFKVEGLFGMILLNAGSEYYNADTGEHLASSKYLFKSGGSSFMASAGIGYRF